MARVHPTAIVEDGATLAADVEIGPYCLVSGQAKLADGVRLKSHVVIAGDTEIGAGTIVFPFAVLGERAQDRKDRGAPVRLKVGARNIVREHVTMHAGTEGARAETRVGDDNMFMAGSHVAHDCLIGSRTTFANCATAGGAVTIEDEVFLGGMSAVHQFCRVGRGAMVAGVCGVKNDIIPFGHASGNQSYLAGLNVVGMNRRGWDRAKIMQIRKGVNYIFEGEGQFAERVKEARSRFAGSPELQEILDFIESPARRPLGHPLPPLRQRERER